MRPAAGSLQGQPWGQQLLWRLQSGPVALAFGSPDTSRPNTGAFYMYAALQDKSVHKYKLIVPASAAKVCHNLYTNTGKGRDMLKSKK